MNTKNSLASFFALSLAAAFAATPSVARAFPIHTGATPFLQEQDKPPEKPEGEKPPAKKQEPKDNPPAHEPDKKPDTKPAKQNPDNPPAKNAKQQPQEKPDKMGKSANQNKKSAHAQQNVHYSFRSEDKSKLKEHFSSQLRSVNRSNRPHFQVGGFIPAESVTYIEPVPADVIALIPPVPEGCVVGFWDGYIIVYYPDDYYIVAYIDLL